MAGRVDIVGLGPGDPSLRTLETQALLDQAEAIILRTGIHPGLEDLLTDDRVTNCDDLYLTLPDFDQVYKTIAERVIDTAKVTDIVFAVPGHPLFGERSVQQIITLAEELNVVVQVHSAVSALDVITSAIGIDPLMDELQLIDAESLDSTWDQAPFSGGWLAIDPTRPCLVGQVYSRQIASHAKLTLARIYPETHSILVITAAGVTGEERTIECAVHELDHQAVDHLTSVFLPPLDHLEAYRTPHSVQRLVAHLRSPEGCPWDRKQSYQSLRDSVIEEAYEVVDAIDDNDTGHMAEELGDLFLLIAMLAQIADEAGDFALEDVYESISRKLIRRHPHVFGDVNATTPDEVIATWEGVKQAERQQAGTSANGLSAHPIDRLPRSMSAVTRVARVLSKHRQTSQPTSIPGNRRQLALDFYDALDALVVAGLDPELELMKVARERVDSRLDLTSINSESQNA
jgi:tetrapyrrole methylase family protein/MazG family protein